MFVTPTKLEKYCYPMKSSYLGNFIFHRWKLFVPPLELKSSKRGTIFGTRMYNEFSTIQKELYLVDEVQL